MPLRRPNVRVNSPITLPLKSIVYMYLIESPHDTMAKEMTTGKVFLIALGAVAVVRLLAGEPIPVVGSVLGQKSDE